MMSWMKTLVSRPARGNAICKALEKPKLSRQEVSDLFHKELAHCIATDQAKRAKPATLRARSGARVRRTTG
jgi:hypothetical protein